jgi:hypothetical protein
MLIENGMQHGRTMIAGRVRDAQTVSRATYPVLIVATQALDALALVVAWGHGVEANPLMAATIRVVGLGGIVAIKILAGSAVAAVVWRAGFRHRGGIVLICLIGCIGALSALLALH